MKRVLFQCTLLLLLLGFQSNLLAQNYDEEYSFEVRPQVGQYRDTIQSILDYWEPNWRSLNGAERLEKEFWLTNWISIGSQNKKSQWRDEEDYFGRKTRVYMEAYSPTPRLIKVRILVKYYR